ncbi:succinate-semialdehyde dehydrogenase [Phaeosphaeria sp. MPI-PUGE-AT-0046c]|nr:succinate-semialdehyde dehydrogenase [Phaeosphaeria sp. MPI-PUGE-AT-0046c]
MHHFELKDPSLLCSATLGPAAVGSEDQIQIEDPATGNVFASCKDSNVGDVDVVVQAAYDAFRKYRVETPRSRAKKLLAWHNLIQENRDDLARTLTYETGKPLKEAYGEIEYASGFTWWFAGEAERVSGSLSLPAAPDRRVLVVKQPIGVCAALVPWNFPVAMILRKVGAALAAGCTIIAKPSPETPLTCLILATLAQRAGFAPGVFSVITTSMRNTPEVSEALCKHSLVSKVSFTGSTAIGSLIAKHCSEGLKKVTLELGGNCPFIVFDDCDQEQALEQLLSLKWRHAGQACVTANRVYVQDTIYAKFVENIVKRTREIKLGHGLEADTTMGPVTTARGVQKAQAFVDDAVHKGAQIMTGGSQPQLDGHFFEATVLSNVDPSMLISQEEVFAPVMGVSSFSHEQEVLDLANDTSMGLASYCFTNDINRIWRMMDGLEAGMIGINTGNSSAAESPFGGMKQSGYGKESGKDVAIEEYLVAKTITLTIKKDM